MELLIRELQYKVLREVVNNPGINVSKISQNILGTFTHVHKIVNLLEKNGLVFSKRPNKRHRMVYPTERGIRVFDAISAAYRELHNEN